MIFAFSITMKRLILFSTSILFSMLLTGCFNKHGISAKYYSDCEEYYDMQGYYHKDCGKDDIVTYDQIQKAFTQEQKSSTNKNVW